MTFFYPALFLLCLSVFAISGSAQTVYTDNGSAASYNLRTNDVLNIVSGEFKGSIQDFAKKATINVAKGAAFTPAAFNNPSGDLNVDGCATLGTINTNNGFTLTNSGATVIDGINFNGAAVFTNKFGATLLVKGSTSVQKQGTEIANSGALYFNADLSVEKGAVLAIQQKGQLYVGGNFNPNGSFANAGYMRVKGIVNINAEAAFTNNCSFIADGGLNNSSNATKNYGALLLNGTNSLFQNNSNFVNGAGGLVQGATFINNATITGSGNFRFTGETRNQGAFGNDNSGINFFDATPPATGIMDVENVKPNPSVTKKAVSAKDTTTVKSNCGASVVSALPITLLSFTGRLANSQATLAWEAADNETGNYFEIQQHQSSGAYETITMVFTTDKTGTDTYTFKTACLQQRVAYRLKIVNKDGSVRYSNVLWLGSTTTGNKLMLLQNPVRNTLSFGIPAGSGTLQLVRIYNTVGVVVYAEKTNGQKGNNAMSLPLQQKMPAGMYVLEVGTSSGTFTTTFIKQ